MKKSVSFFLAALAVLVAYGQASGADLNRFTNVTTHDSSGEYRIVLSFTGKPKADARYFEKSVQIDFPNTVAATKRRAFDVHHAGIDTIRVYQYNPTTARVRIFPTGDVNDLKKNLALAIQGEKMIVKVALPAPPPASAPAAPGLGEMLTKSAGNPTPEEKASKLTADKARPETEARKEATDDLKNSLAAMDGTASADETAAPKGFLKYKDPETPRIPKMGEALVKVGSALMIVLALVFLAAVGGKKYMAAVEGKIGNKRQVKVLSNHFIGVKKSITIVEMGGDVLVLGVTNNNISLLATYDDPKKVEKIKESHRIPERPAGVFKKIKLFPWANNAPSKNKKAFAKEVEKIGKTLESVKMEKAAQKSAQPPTATPFEKQVDDVTAALKNMTLEKTSDEPGDVPISKEELVSNVTRIAKKLRTMQSAAAR